MPRRRSLGRRVAGFRPCGAGTDTGLDRGHAEATARCHCPRPGGLLPRGQARSDPRQRGAHDRLGDHRDGDAADLRREQSGAGGEPGCGSGDPQRVRRVRPCRGCDPGRRSCRGRAGDQAADRTADRGQPGTGRSAGGSRHDLGLRPWGRRRAAGHARDGAAGGRAGRRCDRPDRQSGDGRDQRSACAGDRGRPARRSGRT